MADGMDDVLTEDQCMAIGGHCYELGNSVLASNPPQYTRACKHCGKRQIGQAQDSMRWVDRE